MSCTEPSARLIASRISSVHRPRRLQVAHEVGVDLEELARQRLALEQVGHLRLDALVAAGDRGDRGRRGDGDAAASCAGRASAMRSRRAPSAPGRSACTPHRSNCSLPCAARVSANASCGPCCLGQLGRGPQRVEVDLLADPRATARGPRASRTAARILKNTSCRPISPRPTGRHAAFERCGLVGRVVVDVDDPVEEAAPRCATTCAEALEVEAS